MTGYEELRGSGGTEDHTPESYTAAKSMPDFSGKLTGSNHAPDYQDQRSINNWTRSLFERDSASYNKPVTRGN